MVSDSIYLFFNAISFLISLHCKYGTKMVKLMVGHKILFLGNARFRRNFNSKPQLILVLMFQTAIYSVPGCMHMFLTFNSSGNPDAKRSI